MAIIVGQIIPPSLQQEYAKTTRTIDSWDTAPIQAQQAYSVQHPIVYDRRSEARRDAYIAAEWIQRTNVPGLKARSKTLFIADRVAEIVAGSFNASYWSSHAPSNTYAEKRLPSCVLDVDGVAPGYQDPARRASWCTYFAFPDRYSVPAPESPLPSPSPGWYGDVQGTQWQDRWLVSLRYEHDIGTQIGDSTDTPLWIKCDLTWGLSASHRPNRMWASANISSERVLDWYFREPFGTWKSDYIRPNYVYRLPLNAGSPPWSQSVSRSIILDVRRRGLLQAAINNAIKIQTMVTPTPPHGRYFARNDWAQCWLYATCTAYAGIP